MNKGLNNYSFIVQVICLPIVWIICILKILIAVPVWITMKCNEIMENVQ